MNLASRRLRLMLATLAHCGQKLGHLARRVFSRTVSDPQVHRIRLSRSGLLLVPKPERRFFLALAHLANELVALQKMLLWASDFSSPHEADRQGQISVSLMLLRLLAGKLKEGHELLQQQYFGSALSKVYDAALPGFGREALRDLKRYFSRSNLIAEVRNRFAFHYSAEQVDGALSKWPEAEALPFYISRDPMNTLYYFAECLATNALLESLDRGEPPTAFQSLVAETVKIADLFLVFTDAFMSRFAANNAVADRSSPVDFGGLPSFEAVRIPWFTTRPRRADHPEAPWLS